MTPRLSDNDLLAGFSDDTLDPALFDHREHVRIAWLLLRRHGLPEVLARIEAGLQGLARRAGAPEHYHATLTWAWVLLVRERIRRHPEAEAWPDFAGRNPDLFTDGPALLGLHYSPELLASDRARREFVLPDRAATPPPPLETAVAGQGVNP